MGSTGLAQLFSSVTLTCSHGYCVIIEGLMFECQAGEKAEGFLHICMALPSILKIRPSASGTSADPSFARFKAHAHT